MSVVSVCYKAQTSHKPDVKGHASVESLHC